MALFERKPSGAEALLSERAVFFSAFMIFLYLYVWLSGFIFRRESHSLFPIDCKVFGILVKYSF